MGKATVTSRDTKTIRAASQKTGVTLFTSATAGLRMVGNGLELGARWTDALLYEQTRDQEVASVIREDDRRDEFIASRMDRDQQLSKIKGSAFDMSKSYDAANAAYDELMSSFS